MKEKMVKIRLKSGKYTTRIETGELKTYNPGEVFAVPDSVHVYVRDISELVGGKPHKQQTDDHKS